MKAAGVNVVSTYVIWIHHEEIRGQFDWTGQRDLRAFTQLCAKHGMYVIARIGPWDHAEVRNGGLPDWVLKQGPTRENDPEYLASVRAWYGQIGDQLKGLLWKDGGPVIAIQLENEYSKRGPRAGEAHILELKKIALSSGLDVPLYLITGWDDAVVPPRAVIPVYGGYPDAPWDGSITKLPPAEVYAFRFQSRVAANVNADRGRGEPSALPPASDSLPYLTAEIGGGIEDTYHRRPVIAADDIAAVVPVMLGSGVNLYGTYMFQGGENPDGQLSTLQESQATGYPNDLPIKSYDFQGPLGEFGQERASLRKLKVFDYFLNDFGADLAPMTVHAPALEPRNSADLSVPRVAVRSHGDSGFIFFNNYVRGAQMPVRRAAQFQIRLPGPAAAGEPGVTLAVPRHPIDLPTGRILHLALQPASRQHHAALQPRRNSSLASIIPALKPSILKLCPASRRNSPSMRQPSALQNRRVEPPSPIPASSTSTASNPGPTRPSTWFPPRAPRCASSCSPLAKRKTPGRCASPAAIICSSPARTFWPIPILVPHASVCVLSPLRNSNSPSLRP